MMIPDAFVYPALLLAVYGIYRAGGDKPRSRDSPFEWVRAVALAVFLGLAAALQYKLILFGGVSGPMGLVATTSSLAAMVGLLGLHVVRMMERPAHRHAPAAARPYMDGPSLK